MIRHSASTVNRSSHPPGRVPFLVFPGGDCFCLRYLLSDESWRIELTQKTMEMDFCVVFCDWALPFLISYIKFCLQRRAANYCRTSDNVRLNLANVRAKVILIGHWSDHKKNGTYIFLLWQNPIANSLNLHFAIKFTRYSSILLTVTLRRNGYTYLSRDLYIYLVMYICPTKFSGVGFCLTKFKLCSTKIKSDRTNVLSSQIFICSPATCKMIFQFGHEKFRLGPAHLYRRPLSR
jgi:hypothetical protein